MSKKTIIVTAVVAILILVAAFFVYKSGLVTSEKYTKQYSAEMLTAEQKVYEVKFLEYQTMLEDAVKTYKNGGAIPNVDYFIEKARYAQYLGHNDWAIEILNDVFNYYQNSSVVWNNLAKIYEEEKDYTKANEYYQKVIDTFGESNNWGNYYYICSNLMYMDQKDKTKECYKKYQSLGGSDIQIENYVK